MLEWLAAIGMGAICALIIVLTLVRVRRALQVKSRPSLDETPLPPLEKVVQPTYEFSSNPGHELDPPNGDPPLVSLSALSEWEPPANAEFLDRNTIVVRGDLKIPPRSRVRYAIVVRGSLYLGDGCLVHRGITMYRGGRIGAGSIVLGDVVNKGREPLRIDSGVFVRGVVTSIGQVLVEEGARVLIRRRELTA